MSFCGKIISCIILLVFLSCGSKFSKQDKIRVYNYYIKKAKSNNKLANYNNALAQSNLAINIADTLATAYKTKGTALYHLNKLEEAIDCFDKAIQIEGPRSKIFKNRALAHLKNEDGLFLNDIEAYLKNYPNDKEVRLLKSNYYHTLMNFSSEMTYLKIDYP